MNEEHEYLKRMQTLYGAVIQQKSKVEAPVHHDGWWPVSVHPIFDDTCFYRICPIWLEERLKETQRVTLPEEEHEFKMGQTCYYIDMSGHIDEETWENTFLDCNCYAMGSVYHTKEEAQVARDRQLARVKAERERTSAPGEIWVNRVEGKVGATYSTQQRAEEYSSPDFEYEYIAKRFVEADFE